MAHFIKKCKVCQVVMAQCRCPSPDKEILWDVCTKCAKNEGAQGKKDHVVTNCSDCPAFHSDSEYPGEWGFACRLGAGVKFEFSTTADDNSNIRSLLAQGIPDDCPLRKGPHLIRLER